MQSNRVLIVGESGSGKTVLAAELVRKYREAGKYRYLVVLSADDPSDSPLAKLCEQHQEVDNALAASNIDLAAGIAAAKSLYLEQTALDMNAFLDRLGRACMRLGGVLFVCDEASTTLDRNAPAGILELWTRGRKRGVNTIAITQSVKQRSTIGLNRVVINRSNVLISFQLTDPHEVEDIRQRAPVIGQFIQSLATPRDGAPEFAVVDTATMRAQLHARDGIKELGRQNYGVGQNAN